MMRGPEANEGRCQTGRVLEVFVLIMRKVEVVEMYRELVG
jgi:hypothetical protein